MKTSGNKPNKRCRRYDEAADVEVLARIDIISDMPTYGYRCAWAILRRQSRKEELPFVNAKRVYRIMSENNLLLLHDKPSRQQREHKGRIALFDDEGNLVPINRPPANWKRLYSGSTSLHFIAKYRLPGVGLLAASPMPRPGSL